MDDSTVRAIEDVELFCPKCGIGNQVCLACAANEQWRPIHRFEGRYEVSNLGRVRNVKTHQTLKWRPTRSRSQVENRSWLRQYWSVCLYDGSGRRKNYRVHRLVCQAFIGWEPSPLHTDVNHKDRNPLNNRWDNVEWLTPEENRTHCPPECFCDRCRGGIWDD